jgi:D-glycero-D-manno-heptose 1,7-bisphosphate phosphatase
VIQSSALDKIVILDRDGTIVVDRGYLGDPEGLEFEPGAAEGLRWLHANGYRLVVITNQSGIGRGLFSLERLRAMNTRLFEMVADAGARLEGIYFCPHTPEDQCNCRKPAQGLMTQASSDLGFLPALATVIGDKKSDIEFGQRAGSRTILIAHDSPCEVPGVSPDIIAANLMDAARALTSLRGGFRLKVAKPVD